MAQYIQVGNDVIEFPDDMSSEQITSILSKQGGQAATPAAAVAAPAKKTPSIVEQMIGPGSPSYSLFRGLIIEPVLGVNEMLAKTGLFGQDIKKGATGLVQQERAAYEAGRTAMGREGFDVPQLAGAIISPAGKVVSAEKAIGGGIIQAGMMPSGQEDSSAYATDKLFNMGIGGLIGGAVPAVGSALSYLKKTIADLPITASQKEAAIRRYVDSLTGSAKTEVIAALRNAGQIVTGSRPTTAEAVAEVPGAIGLVKEQQRLAGQVSTAPQFGQRAQQQQAARKGELVSTFGTEADLAAAKAARTAETTPLRQTALEQANVAGQVMPKLETDVAAKQAAIVQNLQGQGKAATEEAQALVRANEWSARGQLRFPERYYKNLELAQSLSGAKQEFGDAVTQRKAEIAFKQLQLKSVADEGFYPLTTQPIIGKIDDSLGRVGERSNALLVNSLQGLRTKLEGLADENGIINSIDLYNVRKEIGSDIKSFLTQRNEPFGAQATNVETSVKKILDKAINDASGTQIWSDYLTKFADHSKKINQMEVGQALIDKLTLNLADVEQAGRFATAVDNSASLIKRTTGVQRYDKLSDFLTEPQMASVEKVRADLARSQKAVEAGKGVKQAGQEAFTGSEVIPSMISPKITFVKSVLDTLKTGSQKELDAKVSELMLDPQKLADFLEYVPKKETSNITASLMAKMSPATRETFKQLMTSSVVVSRPAAGGIRVGVQRNLAAEERLGTGAQQDSGFMSDFFRAAMPTQTQVTRGGISSATTE
jgi:hypothetical protein